MIVREDWKYVFFSKNLAFIVISLQRHDAIYSFSMFNNMQNNAGFPIVWIVF